MAVEDKLPQEPTDINEQYFDAALRHQVGVRRMTSTEVSTILAAVALADRVFSRTLRQEIGDHRSVPLGSRESKAMLSRIERARFKDLRKVTRSIESILTSAIPIEVDFETRLIQNAVPVDINLKKPPLERLKAAILSRPFSSGAGTARTLEQWFEGLMNGDRIGVLSAIQRGVAEQSSLNDMMRTIAGSRDRQFTNGVLATTRRSAETIIRTGMNHIANSARESVWEANSDIIAALMWVSVLDGRTSDICMSRDGKIAPIGSRPIPEDIPVARYLSPPGARPPAHPRCRSILSAVLDGEGLATAIGTRPFIRSTADPRARAKSFRQQARANAGEAQWRSMSVAQRNAATAQLRTSWADRNVGRVPGQVIYPQWLTRQPAEFVEDVLGRTRSRLFLKGGLKVDEFVDRRGATLTLKQLAIQKPDAFRQIGLDPDTF